MHPIIRAIDCILLPVETFTIISCPCSFPTIDLNARKVSKRSFLSASSSSTSIFASVKRSFILFKYQVAYIFASILYYTILTNESKIFKK